MLKIGALELFARLAQRQGQEILLHQGLIDGHLDGQFAFYLLEPDFLARAQDQHALNQVLQLTHISRPGIVAQTVLRGDAETAQRQVLLIDQPIDVVAQ